MCALLMRGTQTRSNCKHKESATASKHIQWQYCYASLTPWNWDLRALWMKSPSWKPCTNPKLLSDSLVMRSSAFRAHMFISSRINLMLKLRAAVKQINNKMAPKSANKRTRSEDGGDDDSPYSKISKGGAPADPTVRRATFKAYLTALNEQVRVERDTARKSRFGCCALTSVTMSSLLVVAVRQVSLCICHAAGPSRYMVQGHLLTGAKLASPVLRVFTMAERQFCMHAPLRTAGSKSRSRTMWRSCGLMVSRIILSMQTRF